MALLFLQEHAVVVGGVAVGIAAIMVSSTVWKNGKFTLTEKIFRQNTYLVLFFSKTVALMEFLPKKCESKLT